MELTGKKVLVCGMAKSGLGAADLLIRKGASVTVSDLKERDELKKEAEFLEGIGADLYLGKNPDEIVFDFDLIVISPGLPFDLPFLVEARNRNIPVIGEAELAFQNCPAPVIAVTGTNGKTTTVSLLKDIFARGEKDVFLVGNIGESFSGKIKNIGEDGFVIAEISSFQLETMDKFKPVVSCVLNITPDHLNRHKTYKKYIEMKERIFTNQDENDYTVLNYDDPLAREMANKTKAKVVFFSRKEELDKGVFVRDNEIYIRTDKYDEGLINTIDLKIIGNHNLENALAAVAVSLSAGLTPDIIKESLTEFNAVEHRLEFVLEINGVKFYNDSKATNVDAAIKALESLTDPVILIGGGQDKAVAFDDWVKLFKNKVKFIAVLGETSDKIIDTLKAYNYLEYEKTNSLKDAVNICFARSKPGDLIVLSPACSSLDMFDNFEQRGRVFKAFVRKLEEEYND